MSGNNDFIELLTWAKNQKNKKKSTGTDLYTKIFYALILIIVVLMLIWVFFYFRSKKSTPPEEPVQKSKSKKRSKAAEPEKKKAKDFVEVKNMKGKDDFSESSD